VGPRMKDIFRTLPFLLLIAAYCVVIFFAARYVVRSWREEWREFARRWKQLREDREREEKL
jgi:hypothetical protein